MTAASALGPKDFREALAAAAFIDPKAPIRRIELASGEHSFAFSLDNDVIKLVTLTPGHGVLVVRVRFAADVVLQDDRHELALSHPPTIDADTLGLRVTWRAPLFSWLAWPAIKRSRRF